MKSQNPNYITSSSNLPSLFDLNNANLQQELDKIKMKPKSVSRTILMFTRSINTPSFKRPCSFVHLHNMNPKTFSTFLKVKKNILSLEKNGLIAFTSKPQSNDPSQYEWIITPKGVSFLYYYAYKNRSPGSSTITSDGI